MRVNARSSRAAFVSLTAIWGLGFFLYVIFWLLTFDVEEDREVELVDGQRGNGLGLAFLGLLLLARSVGWWPGDGLVWVVTAISFAWRDGQANGASSDVRPHSLGLVAQI